MKTFTLLLFVIAATAHAQYYSLSKADTLLLQRHSVVHAVSVMIENRSYDTLSMTVESVTDDSDFAVQGLFGEVPPHTIARMDISAKRTVNHDTDCVIAVLLKYPNPPRQYEDKIVVHGRASTLAVVERKPESVIRERWWDLRGVAADTSRSGCYFSNLGRRIVVLK